MAIILSVETSSTVCSVAIHKDGNLINLIENFEIKSHSRVILSQISEVIKQSLLSFSELDAIAISKGPGSFTGLRIGTAICKGICYGLDIPLIAVDTLKAMALNVNQYNINHSWLMPMVDARRSEVYCCMFDNKLEAIFPTKAIVLDKNSFNEILLHKEVLFFGDGSSKFKGLLSNTQNAVFYESIVPSAKMIGFLANELYTLKSFQNLEIFEPFYLKDFMEITLN